MARAEAAAEAEAVLREKVKLLRETIHGSEAVHEDTAAILNSVKDHMVAIDGAIRPVDARTYEACRVHDNVRRSLRAAGTIVRQLDLVHEAELVILNRKDYGLNAYLEAVDKLKCVEHFFTSKRRCTAGDDVLKRVGEMFPKAALQLENDFRRLLAKCSKPVGLEHLFDSLPSLKRRSPSENLVDPSAKDSSEGQLNPSALHTLPTLVNPRYIPLLSTLAQKGVQLGCHQQFLKIYRDIRGSTLELTLEHLGVEYATKEEVQKVQTESLDAKISQWIQFFRIVVILLFPAERMLCDQIFDGKHTWKDHCFAELTAKSLSTLLSFGKAVAQSQTSPEKVFMLLNIYEATLELRSEVEAVFEGNACSGNRKSALSFIKCLAQTAKKAFFDFKESIIKDSAKIMTTDGAVHPLTSYVINNIKFLFDYQSSLKQIFEESCTGDGTNSDVISQIIGVIHALETNLDIKSKQYKDHALGHLFLMNNIHYIVRSEVKDLFGDDWIQRRRRIVQQHAIHYRRAAWGKVLEILSARGLTSSVASAREVTQGSVKNIGSKSSTTSRSVIKERFRIFNVQFEVLCQTQIDWNVPDRELRDNLILAIAEVLLPAYRSFLKHFGPFVQNSRSTSKYMKYTPEALEQALGNLFAKKVPSEQGH